SLFLTLKRDEHPLASRWGSEFIWPLVLARVDGTPFQLVAVHLVDASRRLAVVPAPGRLLDLHVDFLGLLRRVHLEGALHEYHTLARDGEGVALEGQHVVGGGGLLLAVLPPFLGLPNAFELVPLLLGRLIRGLVGCQ